jgi:hypothetical protein
MAAEIGRNLASLQGLELALCNARVVSFACYQLHIKFSAIICYALYEKWESTKEGQCRPSAAGGPAPIAKTA